jgi:uncharacterized protein YndB with AHSA1/START domain
MPDILHRVEVKSSPKDTYQALATRAGLAAWWTDDTQGSFGVDGIIQFRFGERGGFDMKVLELEPGKRVSWQVVAGPEDWLGTKVSFDLKESAGATTVLFKHQGWKEPVEFMHHCSTKWATFLMSMKSLLESGKGAPYPDDVHVTAHDD